MQLDGAASGTMYGIRHTKVHAIALQLMTQGGYEDVMLIDGNDRVVYTARKGADFAKKVGESGTNKVGEGPVRNPQLSTLLAQLKSAKKGEAKFLDFAVSSPGADHPVAYIGAPIIKKSNVAMDGAQEDEQIGFAVLTFSPAILDRVFSARDGLGRTGETFCGRKRRHH